MVFNRAKNFISYWYLQYLLATSVYMLEPIERRIFNCCLIIVLAMFMYTSYVFLPDHARMIVYFINSYILGKNQPEIVDGVQIKKSTSPIEKSTWTEKKKTLRRMNHRQQRMEAKSIITLGTQNFIFCAEFIKERLNITFIFSKFYFVLLFNLIATFSRLCTCI